MNKRLLALLLTLCCVLALFPAASATETVPCLTVDSFLVIIGDSNTVFLKRNNPDIQPARIFARVNATIAECVEDYSRYHADGYNQGIYRLITGLSGSSIRTVVINIGTNNAGTPSDTFRNYYRQLLDLLYAKNPNLVIYVCKILPINPSHYNGAYPNIFTHANINRINGLIAELQAEYAGRGCDTRIMDLNTPFKNAAGNLLPEYDSGGGIHLTTAGYRRLNRIVQTILAQGDPAVNHSWSQLETLTAPSCGAPGEARRVCAVCAAAESVVLPPTGLHSWNGGTVLTAPGCTADGLSHYVCGVCGAVEDRTTPALGHAWTVAETLTEAGAEDLHGGTARYACARCGETKEGRLCAAEVFTDMPADDYWAHTPIDWAYFSGVTSGKTPTTFAPKAKITRAEAMTFLWTLAGRPEPTLTESPFGDVKPDKYYYKPVLWAVENHITSGKTETTFAPKAQCSRAEIMTFLWTAAGRPEPTLAENPFEDVPEGKYYYNPILWAFEHNVTGGVSATAFGPRSICTRAQVVTFLYKSQTLLFPDPTPDPDPTEPTELTEPTEPEPTEPTDPIEP